MWFTKALKTFAANPSISRIRDNEVDESYDKARFEKTLLVEPLGRLPMWTCAGLDTNKVKHINRYLRFMNRRIMRLKEEGKTDQLIYTWCWMLKNSESYQLCLFNRVKKQWYWVFDKHKALTLFLDITNSLRRWRLDIYLERFYILKRNGKWRPIGCPNIKSRVITRSMADLVYLLFQDERAKYQHGFIKGRGIHTAFYEIVRLHCEGYRQAYEFDFQSFFNKIDIKELLFKLEAKTTLLSNLIMGVLLGTHYSFKELKKEAEIEMLGKFLYKTKVYLKGKPKVTYKYKNLYARYGLPQGTNLSPLLSTLTIEGVKSPEGLVMFADDGLVMHDGHEGVFRNDILPWLNGLWFKGAIIEPTKSGNKTSTLKFLGIEVDLVNQKLSRDGKVFHWTSRKSAQHNAFEAMMWVRSLNITYNGIEVDEWGWDPSGISYIAYQDSELKWYKWIYYCILCWWDGKVHMNHKYFDGIGLRNVASGSTVCMNELVKDLQSYPRKQKARIHLSKGSKKWKLGMNEFMQ